MTDQIVPECPECGLIFGIPVEKVNGAYVVPEWFNLDGLRRDASTHCQRIRFQSHSDGI
jgi:hypothetical protein